MKSYSQVLRETHRGTTENLPDKTNQKTGRISPISFQPVTKSTVCIKDDSRSKSPVSSNEVRSAPNKLITPITFNSLEKQPAVNKSVRHHGPKMALSTRGNTDNVRTGQEPSTTLRRGSEIVKSRLNKELEETKSKSGIRLKRYSEQIVTKSIQKPQSNNYQQQSFADEVRPADTKDDDVLPDYDDIGEKFEENAPKLLFTVKEADDDDSLCLDNTPPGAKELEKETQDDKLTDSVVEEVNKDSPAIKTEATAAASSADNLVDDCDLEDDLLDFLNDGEDNIDTQEQVFDDDDEFMAEIDAAANGLL